MSRIVDGGTIAYSNFTKGMSTKQARLDMDSRYSMRLQNCHVNQKGSISKMPGYAKLHQDKLPTTIKTGTHYKPSTGDKEIIVAGGGRVYSFNPVDWTWVEIESGLDLNATVRFAQFQNYLIMVNGVDAPRKYDGTTTTLLGGGPPIASAAYTFKNRLWLNDVNDRMLAWASALQDAEDWTSPNNSAYIDFQYVLPKGDELIDFGAYSQYHVFFFKSHIALYVGDVPTGEGDYALQQIIPNLGLVNTGGNINVGNDLIFASLQGIKRLSLAQVVGALDVGDISDEIDEALVPTINVIADDEDHEVHMAVNPENNYLMINVGSYCWVYQYGRKAWALMYGHEFSGLFTDEEGTTYLCGFEGFLYRYADGWSHGGKEVEAWWESAWVRPKKTLKVYPKIAELELNGREQELTFRLRFDNDLIFSENIYTIKDFYPSINMDALNQGQWEETLQMDTPNDFTARLAVQGNGNVMQWSLHNKSTDGPITFNEIRFQVKTGAL